MGNGHVISHRAGYQGPPFGRLVNRLLGGLFVYTDASTVTLDVTGLDQWMYLSVSDGQDLTQIVRMFNDLTCNLAVSGAGGLHNAFAEVIDTPYVIYAAWDPTTEPDEDDPENPADLVLFAVPSGTVVNGALVAALTGGGAYRWWSEPIGLMVNDGAGDLYEFYQRGTSFRFFNADYGPLVVTNFVAMNYTIIDFSAFVPDEAIRIGIRIYCSNVNATASYNRLHLDDGTNHFFQENILSQTAVGGSKQKEYMASLPILNTASDSFGWINVSNAPNPGASCHIQEIKLY